MKSIILKILILSVLFLENSYSQNLVTVGAQKPILKDVSDILKIPGSITANEKVMLTSVVSEKIKRIHFEEGKFVKKGQLLVEFFDNEEQATLIQAKAELEEAEINYNRAVALSKKGNISQSILDNREMSKKKLYGKVQEINAKIDDLKIKAPFDGYTGIRNFSEGSFIKPGDIITQIYDIQFLKVLFYIPENFTNRIKIGEKFILDVRSGNLRNIKGSVSVIDAAIDQKTRTFKVIGKIKNADGNIKPGMMVNIKITLERREAILIKENSIISEDDITFVYILDKENVVKKKKIEVGFKEDGMIEVLSGLDTDDLVIHQGINKVKEGIKIKLK